MSSVHPILSSWSARTSRSSSTYGKKEPCRSRSGAPHAENSFTRRSSTCARGTRHDHWMCEGLTSTYTITGDNPGGRAPDLAAASCTDLTSVLDLRITPPTWHPHHHEDDPAAHLLFDAVPSSDQTRSSATCWYHAPPVGPALRDSYTVGGIRGCLVNGALRSGIWAGSSTTISRARTRYCASYERCNRSLIPTVYGRRILCCLFTFRSQDHSG